MSLEISDIIEQACNPYDLRSLFRNLERLRSAAPDDDDDGGEDNDDDDDDDDGDDGSGGTGQNQDKDDVQDPDKKRLSDEAAKYRRLRREERQKREQAEARLRELENKDKGDAERLQGELETVTSERDDLKSQVESFAKEVAIARAIRGKGVTDPDYLEHLLDKEKVEYLDEDGEIADISDVVESILKKKPSLVATSGDEDDEDDDDDDKKTRQPSGRRTDGKGKGKAKNGTDFETLAAKFPALAGRR